MSNFHRHFVEACGRFPERVAVEWVGAAGSETTTYRQLIDAAARIATRFDRAQIRAGDRIAILAPNSAAWIATYVAALQANIVVVPLDTAYSAAQVLAVIADSGARAIFTTTKLLAAAREAAASCDAAPRIVLLADAEPGITSYDALLAERARDHTTPADANDAAAILYTSGTTADPKGVVLTHGNLHAERTAVLDVVKADERDVVLGVLPLFHALAEMANLWLPLTIGARVVFLETVSSTTLLDALQTRGVTILACVPQFFYLIHQRVVGELGRRGVVARAIARGLLAGNTWLRDHIGWNPGRRVFARVHQALGPRMRLLITGGSRFDPAIARDLHGLGVSLYNGYGLTETSGAAAIMRPGDRFTTSVGQPLSGVDVRIVHGDDAEVRDDGEILIRGPIVMREYWRRPDATASVLRDGWLHTGDLGRLDRDGRLYITGRLKEIIVLASGKNLYPEEIEAHYRQSPFIGEIAVMGLSRDGEPSAERLHAVIVPNDAALRERGIVNVRDLIRFELEGLSVQLPAHKRILSYDIRLEPLPRTTTGKLRRGEIERLVRERSSEPAETSRAETIEEQQWLAGGNRRAAVDEIAAHLRRPRVTPDANLELDLGLDSMERVELLAMLESRHGVAVRPDARARIFTVRQLMEAVEAAPRTAQVGTRDDDRTQWAALLDSPGDPALAVELARPKIVRALVIWLVLRLVLLVARLSIDLRVNGRAHVPTRTPFIVAPNHQTFLDGFVVGALLPFRAFRRIFFVGAAEFFDTPLTAWGARAINIVSIDPDANLVSAMQAAAAGLRLGRMLVLFPEGERTIDGDIKPFRKGAAILAAHLDVPVVPVAIDGLFPFWPRGRAFGWRALLPWRRTRVTITFCPPLHVTTREIAEKTEELHRVVSDRIAAIRT